jgi:tellurite resistance protein
LPRLAKTGAVTVTIRVRSNMSQIFESDSLLGSTSDDSIHEDFESLEDPRYQEKSSVKNLTYMRQIEIIRENKLLLSSLKDVYDS